MSSHISPEEQLFLLRKDLENERRQYSMFQAEAKSSLAQIKRLERRLDELTRKPSNKYSKKNKP